jgi:antitoxin component of RelBE/YafQ-DinJ toxin-antitoxin module
MTAHRMGSVIEHKGFQLVSALEILLGQIAESQRVPFVRIDVTNYI